MMNVRSPVVLGRWTSSTRSGWPSAGASTSLRLELAVRLGVVSSPASRSLSRTVDLLALEAPGQQLGLEPDGVVDEHDVVDQQLGQLEVAGRLGAAQADRVERHSLARGQLGGLGERFALGGLAVGEQHDRRRRAPRSSVSTWRTAVAQPRLGARRPRARAPSRRPARRRRAGRPRRAAGPSSRRGRAGPCAASAARGAAGPGPSGSAPWRSPAGSSGSRPPRPSVAAAARLRPARPAGSARASRAFRTSGLSYWSAICSLAESSTRIVRYGKPVRSTERTASESMNIASSTSAIRSAGQHDLGQRSTPSPRGGRARRSSADAAEHREDEQPLRPRLLEADVRA